MPKTLVRFVAILLLPCLLAEQTLSVPLFSVTVSPNARTFVNSQALSVAPAWFGRLPWFIKARRLGSRQATTALTFGVIASVFVGGYAVRGFQTVSTNPTFRGFWMQDPTKLDPSVEAFILEAMLHRDEPGSPGG